MQPVALEDRIREIARQEGVDFFGIADLAVAKEELARQGGPGMAKYPRAISLGIRLFDEIVDQLPDRKSRAVAVSYRTHCYDVINLRLDEVASKIAGEVQRAGHRAYPVPASARTDDERICAVFSHKLAAHLAGLGWIGKSCLLVTPEAGPRVRFVTVLTDALLPAGEPMEVQCGNCTECVDACPVQAFTGRNFREDEPREARYDARKCEAYFKAMEKESGPAVCGMCLYACPHGLKT
ncbi:4Fe-4S double cluster binding domain-containing protein [Methanocella arvoryzae]|uniref:4Fe-4S ferredoxin-domain protein n=1 Tax=Methanocella arvoryzae (strain DSM 22066 / NBRC 105507 / MRE50) TaxID=351160 RepID=Q0W7Q6_METAR|nr:4Fe-4S double cluster binding domain-containing protein [Methanocella arvoryzae]CAJ35587.1 4Fe-4S ferredoxin-domain protein [Methanocella arvoryzae MRE50]